MPLADIYTELIAEESRNTENRRKLTQATHTLKGKNPSCGDEITLELCIKNGKIEDAAFSGIGCAISQASTSMMIDLIKGKTVEEAKELSDSFRKMIRREITDEEELAPLEDTIAFKPIANMPARVKCAVLPWHTLKNSLAEKE